jgi:hypothetical protein
MTATIRVGLAVACFGLLLTPPPSAAAPISEVAKLTASDGAADDRFGASVAVSGDMAVVGAPRASHNGFISGAAYGFRYDGTSWVEETKLTASDGREWDQFGTSVALSGDAAVVGGLYSGAAYVFRYDGASWVEEAKLTASDGTSSVGFGGSVALWGDTAVVGAAHDDDKGSYSGAAYVFRYDGTSWVEEAKLTASDGASGDAFGHSVALWGDMAVVGASQDDDNGSSSGSVYVFQYDGTSWVEEAKLTASDGAFGDLFGARVAVSGDAAVVGGASSGSAYAFRRDGTSWVEEAKLTASDGASGDGFGMSVAVSGDTAVVGAPYDKNNGVSSGSAYGFRYDGTSWVEEAKLSASDGASGDVFGHSVAVSGGTAVVGSLVGALRYDWTEIGPGAAWAFSLPVSVTPIVWLSADPTTIVAGGSSTLTWTTEDATSCLASGGWGGSRATSGSEPVSPLGVGPTTYTLTCDGPEGSSSDSVNVTVVPSLGAPAEFSVPRGKVRVKAKKIVNTRRTTRFDIKLFADRHFLMKEGGVEFSGSWARKKIKGGKKYVLKLDSASTADFVGSVVPPSGLPLGATIAPKAGDQPAKLILRVKQSGEARLSAEIPVKAFKRARKERGVLSVEGKGRLIQP